MAFLHVAEEKQQQNQRIFPSPADYTNNDNIPQSSSYNNKHHRKAHILRFAIVRNP